MSTTIITANGKIFLEPIFCEITGERLGWKSVLSEESIKSGCTPVYVSFKVVNKKCVQLIDTLDIDTF